jgi:hypothetical protein
MSERRPVPRIGRVLDLVAALVFAIGAGLYARSWAGLRDMDAYVRPEDGDMFATVIHANELSRLGRVGLGLMIGGIVVGVVAATVARRVAAREA